MKHRRMDRLEQAVRPDKPPIAFRFCEAPEGLTPAEHEAWHHQRGESTKDHWTLDLGDDDIREDP